jgi:hypothetical protein
MAMQTDCLFEHHQSQQAQAGGHDSLLFRSMGCTGLPAHTARLTHPQLHLNPNGRCLLVRCVPRRLSIKCVVTLGWWPWLGLFISQRCLASGSKPLGSRSLACLTGCPIAYRGMIPHSFDWACTRTLW